MFLLAGCWGAVFLGGRFYFLIFERGGQNLQIRGNLGDFLTPFSFKYIIKIDRDFLKEGILKLCLRKFFWVLLGLLGGGLQN